MPFPTQIQIRRFIYDAQLCSSEDIAFTEDGILHTPLGWCRESELKIRIEKDHPPLIERQVLLHEVVHAILYATTGMYDHDEAQVEQLSHGLLELILDNPQLIDYIREVLPPCASPSS